MLTFLVVNSTGEELIIGIGSIRQMNILQHTDAVIEVQHGFDLLYSHFTAAEDSLIVDTDGHNIDMESCYCPEPKTSSIIQFWKVALAQT